MFAKMIDRKSGIWVFLAWQMVLACVMGVLMCMAFFLQGFVRRGITVALLVMLSCWFINEVLMVKYVLALPKDDEVPEEDGAKVSENWLSLRKKYNTLDETSHRGIRSDGKWVSQMVNEVDDFTETTAIPMSEMQAYFKRLQDEKSQDIG